MSELRATSPSLSLYLSTLLPHSVVAFRALTSQLVRLVVDLKKNDMIGLRMCGRSRRPSEGSRRSRVWTSPTPTSALKARGSHTFPALEPHSAAPRSVPRHHQQGHGEPRGRPSPLLQARSKGRLVERLSSTRQVELWGTTISSSRPLSPPAPPCWRSSTSLCTSGCPTNSTRSGSRRAVATWLLPTSCRAPRPPCARSSCRAGAAAGRRRQASPRRRRELILEQLARAMTARGLVADRMRVGLKSVSVF